MVTAGAHVLVTLHILSAKAIAIQVHEGRTERLTVDRATMGSMNRAGVTRYQHHEFKRSKREDGKFFWPDSANRDGLLTRGPTDLVDNVTWGWHHPNGVYNTIPVGSPLIDEDSNIYAAADDAIRKFDIVGDIKWSYAPRGQLAAAPTLAVASSRRQAARLKDDLSAEEELQLRPDWAKPGNESHQFFKDFKVGDLVKVKPGAGYRSDGKQHYQAGDQGLISSVIDDRAVIVWTHTGHKSVLQLHALTNRFVRVEAKKATTSPPMLVGSTTAGYVFAIELLSGTEVWATWASNTIAGVKGSVAAKDGIVVVATDTCHDRYCYRYRNVTVPLQHGNSVVRGLSLVDGSAVWEFRTTSPVWNMNPLWGNDGSVLFQDYEARVYCLDLQTGALRWDSGRGSFGTHTEAAAVYSPAYNMVYSLGVYPYEDKYCNPYVAPGVLVNCDTWPGVPGFVRGFNATSGRKRWEVPMPEPPASAAVGMLNSPALHTRLVVTMGFNCLMNSPTQIWALDPHNGHMRWKKDGPTLWRTECAGDKEGADIRRVMGGRAVCHPNSWSVPAIDSVGDIYVGNQVGELQRWGSSSGGGARTVELLSTLKTDQAFQDVAIGFGDGVMAVSTCSSLIVFQTSGR